MKRVSLFAVSAALLVVAATTQAAPVDYGDVTLSGGAQAGHFNEVWDLTAGDITVSFTYDGNGLVDDLGGAAHAWAELGVRSLGSADFNPYVRYPVLVTDLVAGQFHDVGDLIVYLEGSHLFVRYVITVPECAMVETHLAVATTLAGIPQTRNGNPIPGRFPYAEVHVPPVAEWTVMLDWPLADEVVIAAHASLTCSWGQESVWAAGIDFPGPNWATYLTYEAAAAAGSGVWLATDYDWTVNTFDPDVAPSLDLDDKLILQRQGGQGEAAYNLPSAPPAPGNNHRVWWDRDGVDPWQDPATANTGGVYQVELHLHATSATAGTAYLKIRDLWQGFETDGNWNTIELTPAGMTFVGDMEHLVIFYGISGYGATHSVQFRGITVEQGP